MKQKRDADGAEGFKLVDLLIRAAILLLAVGAMFGYFYKYGLSYLMDGLFGWGWGNRY